MFYNTTAAGIILSIKIGKILLIVEKKNELDELFTFFEIFEKLKINRSQEHCVRICEKIRSTFQNALILVTCRFYGIKYSI